MSRLFAGFFLMCCLSGCSSSKKPSDRTDSQLVADVLYLSREKVDERIQLALIAAHGRAVSLEINQILDLRREGVSDRVIERLITGPLP